MTEHLAIDELGAQGDGIARTAAGPVYVRFALPGETVTATVTGQRGTLRTVRRPSALRAAPACRHFGACGGCAVQHLAPEAYLEWKREKVERALASRGLSADVEPLVPCAPASRRRVTFTARLVGGNVLLGFNAAQSHQTVAVSECPIAVPEIVASLADLKALAGIILADKKPIRLTVTSTRTGLDIATDDVRRLDEKKRQKAVDLVLAKGFARLTICGETIVERERPVVLFAGVPVAVPPGGFLQATTQAEEAMAGLVAEHLYGARHVADLFSGSGTFALRLARKSRVHAVEGDAAALRALDEAARLAPGLKPVKAEKRDLFHRPLTAKELHAFDGLVFDPPRSGAEAQCRQIARSPIRRIAAVSCNPGTLARDLALLIEGGYRIMRVVPIDQFLWSPHVEVVALLERAGKP